MASGAPAAGQFVGIQETNDDVGTFNGGSFTEPYSEAHAFHGSETYRRAIEAYKAGNKSNKLNFKLLDVVEAAKQRGYNPIPVSTSGSEKKG